MKRNVSLCWRAVIRTLLTAWCLQLAWAQAQTAESTSAEPVFDVYEYAIEGNTVLSDAVIERAVMPYMGESRRFADIENARAALEKAYQDAGYLSVLVSLPNQRVDHGEVKLVVVEAPVKKLTVSGAEHHLPSRIRESLPALQEGRVPHFPSVQKQIADAQTATLQITPLVNASDTGEAIDIDLKVEDKAPYFGSFEVSNAQSYNTTRGRTNATVGINNLFQRGYTAALSWQYSPRAPDQVNTVSLLYGLPLAGGDDLMMTLTESNSDTPTSVSSGGPTSILTKGTFFGLRWNHKLQAAGWPVRHNVFFGVDYKRNSDSSTFVNGDIVQRPPTRYPLLTAGYSLTHTGEGDVVSTLSASVRGISSSLADRKVNCDGVRLEQFDCKRAGAASNFGVVQVAVGHARPVLGNWRFNLTADAQLATGAVPSGEQYSLGGVNTVRGYYDFEQSGDAGWRTRVELVSPAWLNLGSLRATALGFVDRGFVYLFDPQPTQQGRTHLGSYGLGLRFFALDGLRVNVDYARVVFDTIRPTGSGAVEFASGSKAGRDHRIDVSVQYAF